MQNGSQFVTRHLPNRLSRRLGSVCFSRIRPRPSHAKHQFDRRGHERVEGSWLAQTRLYEQEDRTLQKSLDNRDYSETIGKMTLEVSVGEFYGYEQH